MNRIREETVEYLFKVTPVIHAPHPEDGDAASAEPDILRPRSVFTEARAEKPEFQGPSLNDPQSPGFPGGELPAPSAPMFRPTPSSKATPLMGGVPTAASIPSKIGRNDPCPCGSGKKYKKCCGQ